MGAGLIDLAPAWVPSPASRNAYSRPVPAYDGAGISFNCPCGNSSAAHRAVIMFENPVGASTVTSGWRRSGETFSVLTLTPGIRQSCGWAGMLTAGQLVPKQ